MENELGFKVPKSMELIEIVEPGIAKVLMVNSNQIQHRYLPGNPQGKKNWAMAKLPPQMQANLDAVKENPELARQFGRMGAEQRAKKKGEAIVRMAKERGLDISTPLEVYAEAAALLTMEVFNDENSLRDRLEAYKKVGGDVGMVENLREHADGGQPVVAIQINVSPEMAKKYIDEKDTIIDVEI